MAREFSSEDAAKGQARGREVRAAIAARINVKSVPWPENKHETRLRRDDEVASMKNSIKWKCYECLGYESAGFGSLLNHVKNCNCPGCPLYPWRGGEFDKEMLDV